MVDMPARSQPPDERAIATALLDHALVEGRRRPGEIQVLAHLLTGFDCPVAPRLVAELLAARLTEQVGQAVRGGWTPTDLAQLLRRRGDERHLGHLAGLIGVELTRHPTDRVHPGWFHELDSLGFARRLVLLTVDGAARGLALAIALDLIPTIAQVLPPPGAVLPVNTRAVHPSDAQRLAKVRALLAKAESTEFPEEAEALSGKAQELISRYALDRLITAAAAPDIRVRRVWLDPPYIIPKATLVDVVASANRCRTAVSERLGHVTVVGDPDDLEAVELLVTSLLVQASVAMINHGRASGRMRAAGRTTSFRRAFLLAYASRIGERLTRATDEAMSTSSRRDALVPVLRQRAEQVDAAFDETFPRIRTRRLTTYSNLDGWDAGRAAADQAQLDPRRRVTGG
jgi:hypothetical protein